MTRKARAGNSKPRKHNLLLAVFVTIAVLIILLRMVTFVVGHGHHKL